MDGPAREGELAGSERINAFHLVSLADVFE
jgi:hypothetical protein